MISLQQMLDALASNKNLCDIGYQYAEYDYRGYCLWVIDCVRHILPITERYLSPSHITQLSTSLDMAVEFINGDTDIEAVISAAQRTRQITQAYYSASEKIRWDVSETLDAINNAIELTLPNTSVYHEDVLSAAARVAYYGHLDDDVDSLRLSPSDCNNTSELLGYCESKRETVWQRMALSTRLLKDESKKL